MQQILDWANENLNHRYTSGDEHVFDCPFCAAEQKLWYNDDKNVYLCYRCGETGSGFKMVMEEEDITYEAARKMLGVEEGAYRPPPSRIEDVFAEVAQRNAEREVVANEIQSINPEGLYWHGVMSADTYWCQAYYDIAQESLTAVLDRRFSLEMIQDMRVGYFVEGKYRDRTCLPVFRDGKFVFFQAWDHGKRFDPKLKYLNPRNDEVPFGRSDLIYNYDRWAYVDELVVVEGVFNAWSVEQAGFAAVATFGKAMKSDGVQLGMLLSHPCKRLILGHDEDARAESVKTCRALRGAGKDCVIARVPKGKDWNDLAVSERQDVLREASVPDWLFE